ncbi:MAG: SGNH/GDSL hydrolase family protein [Synechococcales cyanobacterium RM1_1_8]|nr:SGNH/GDSL hydrolase family protein [Synechococcales cyanobacterium RM1_1_8]
MVKPLLLLSAAILGLLLIAELVLRFGFGFGNPPLYQGDDQIGYLLQPSQSTRRFGNRIQINRYSMRADEISPQPEGNLHRLFLIGDSIVNGGWWTDQGDILSELLSQQMAQRQPSQRFETLNASANSWGPRNELAYLQRFGTFGSEALVLVINTDDLFAVAPTAVPVGRDRNYPNRKPASAWAEVLGRYIFKGQADPRVIAARDEAGDRTARNLQAIAEIQAIAQTHQAQFLLAMTPLKRELASQGGPRDYEIRERQRLHNFVTAQGIAFVDFLPIFDRQPEPLGLYYDHIHLSLAGNQLVSGAIADKLTP